MEWYCICLNPKVVSKIQSFPFTVGRVPGPTQSCAVVEDPHISQQQFTLQRFLNKLYYVNQSQTNPAEVNGGLILKSKELEAGQTYIVKVGEVVIGLGTDWDATFQAVADASVELYMVEQDGNSYGPMTEDLLLQQCESHLFRPDSKVWTMREPDSVQILSDLVDFEETPAEPSPGSHPSSFAGSGGVQEFSGVATPPPASSSGERKHVVSAEEECAVLGESFMCPFCRTVSALEDVLSVSVSPSLLGDPVLGEGEQRRFLPSQFTGNGLALDSEGGVCTEIACPRCHMSLPQALLDTPQMVMSVIGAAGAGKSVFLASSMWQCRQELSRLFGVSFMDLDPVANRWINAYEEKLFFQENSDVLQQIEKTDLQSSTVCRSVILDGDSVLLPLPSFFQVQRVCDTNPQSLVVYDSAGEHFRAGADTQASAVTLNMLNADVLFFMFDPSADPRFRALLDRGTGTAQNYAQRQDVLLAEVAARIRRHLGNKRETRLSRPLLFGVSKADLLHAHLPLDAQIYRKLDPDGYALDLDVLHEVSEKTEAFLRRYAPEVSITARSVASDVWFVPVSALGHNPMREGVRPCDIKPLWTELPVVFTLAKKGLIPTVGERSI